MREEEEIRRIITMSKWLFVLMLVLIIVELVSCAKEAKAGTITGETQLAGISLVRQQVIDKGKDLPEVEDIKLLAEVMWHENWSTDKEHLAAYYTGAVVMNRVRSDKNWLHLKGDKTVYDVVYAKGQYSTTHKFYSVKLPDECYQLALKVAKGTPDVPEDIIYQATFPQGHGVWKKINGEYFCYE